MLTKGIKKVIGHHLSKGRFLISLTSVVSVFLSSFFKKMTLGSLINQLIKCFSIC